ncbi:MAG TPA: vWA domain-containing protein, partial [Roseiflexaceae bacterium]|nr:vWA domain-containing protein [Roseiflexaceae bacterium]
LVAQAQAEEQRKEYATAIQTWQRALQLAPDHKIARDGLKRAREQEEAQRRAQQQQLTRTSQQAVQQQDAPRKIDYAVAAAWHFIQYLHRDGFDRGMVATFGDDCRLAQGFTSRASQLQTALARVSQSVGGQTRLYDSMQDIVYYFYQHGDKRRPWLLTVITDGMDNASQDYRQRPDLIGAFLGQTFMSDRTNFMFLIGVGEGREIDASALATIGRMGGFPATTIAAFSLLEELFVQIALQVTEQLVGQQVRVGNLSWAEIARVRQVAHVPLDYAFLIDRSTSMNSAG